MAWPAYVYVTGNVGLILRGGERPATRLRAGMAYAGCISACGINGAVVAAREESL